MSRASERRQGTPFPQAPRGDLVRQLTCLAVAQVSVALLMRLRMWPNVNVSFLVRQISAADLGIAAGFAIAGLSASVALGRWRWGRSLVATLAWTFAIVHIFLLVGNVRAVDVLHGPLTYQWVLTGGVFDGGTPFLMIGSVLSASDVALLLLSLAFPVALLMAARMIGAKSAWFARQSRAVWPLATLAIACFAISVSAKSTVVDAWRDGSSNPLRVLAVSYWMDPVHELLQSTGDGRTDDYAVRPAAPASRRIPAGSQRPDLLVVVLESVRARTIYENIDQLPTMRRMLREGTSFPNAFVAYPSSTRTMVGLLLSRFPRPSSINETKSVIRGFPRSYPWALRQGGYATMFVQGGDFAFQEVDKMMARTAVGDGIDSAGIDCRASYDMPNRSGATTTNAIYVADACSYAATEAWFTSHRGPRAAIVWPVNTHFPYDMHEHRADAAPPRSLAAYEDAVRNSDRLLGEMLGRLAKRGIHPIVVVVGDHGEQFMEHGAVMHGQTVYREEVEIPFIVSGPGIPAGKVDPRFVNIVDVAPTLIDLAGLPRPAGWQGLSAFGSAVRQRSFSLALQREPQASVQTGSRKVVMMLRTGNMRAFDLATDPRERNPLPVDDELRRRTSGALASWMQYNDALYAAK